MPLTFAYPERFPNHSALRRLSWMSGTPWGSEKNAVYVVTAVDRATQCIVGHTIVPQRSFEVFQAVVNKVRAPRVISALAWRPTPMGIIAGHPMPRCQTSPGPFPWKGTRRNYGITWRGGIGARVVFPKVWKPCDTPYVFLCAFSQSRNNLQCFNRSVWQR